MTPDGPESELSFVCGDVPSFSALIEAGHEPNGEFWVNIVEFKAPDLADRLDLNPEADFFLATGGLSDITALQGLLEPYLQEPARVASLLQEAEQAGVDLRG